jgi:hypothetical protein
VRARLSNCNSKQYTSDHFISILTTFAPCQLLPMKTCFLICFAGMLACTTEIIDQTDDASGGSGAGGVGGAMTTIGGSHQGGGLVSEYCTEACSAPSVDGGCFTKEDCQAACAAGAPSWSEEARIAFAACAAEDPLCFITLEGCMLTHLSGPRTVRYTGTGFEAFNGRTLRVRIADTNITEETSIQGGAFDFTWRDEFEVFDLNGPFVIAFIDTNTNGECDPNSDVTMSAATKWTGTFNDVTYTATITPPDSPAEFVCDSL